MAESQDIIITFKADTNGLTPAVDVLEKLDKVTKKNADAFKSVNDEAKKATASMVGVATAQKDVGSSLASNSKNIDLVSNALKQLGVSIPKDQIKNFAEGVLLGMQDAFKDIDPLVKTSNKNFKDLAGTLKGIGGKSVVASFLDQSLNVNKTATSVGTLKQALVEAKNEAQRLAISLGADATETINAQRNVAKLANELDEFNKRTKAFNPADKFASISASFQAIAGSIAIASGTLTLFGADAKQAEEITKKLDAALKLTAGLSAVSQLGGEFKNVGLALGILQPQVINTAVATEALAVAEGEAAVAGGAAAAGTTAFSSALKLSPIGLFLIALTGAVAAYALLSDNLTEAEKAQESLNEARQKGIADSQKEVQQVKVLVEEYKASNTTKQRQSEILKELNATYPSYFKNLDTDKITVDELTASYEKLVASLVLKSQIENIIDKAAENRNEAARLRNEKDSDATIAANKVISLIAQGQAFETNEGKARKLDAQYKELIKSASQLSKELDKSGGDPNKKVDAPAKSAATEKVKEIKKEVEDVSKIIDALRKKELAADLENLKIFVAARKESITNSTKSEEEKEKERTALQLAELKLRLLYYQQYGEDVGDVLNQIAELNAKIKKEAEVKVDIHPNAQDFKDQEEALKKANDAAIELANQKAGIIRQIENESTQIAFDLFAANIDAQLALLEEQTTQEQEVYDERIRLNQEQFDKRIITAKQFRAEEDKLNKEKVAAEKVAQTQINELRRKADIADRAEKVFQIAIATARNIVELTPLQAPLIPFYIALGAVQTAAVLAQPLPKYAKGTLSLQGNNDEVPIIAHRGEAITPTKQSKEYNATLRAIHERSIPAEALNNFVKGFNYKPSYVASTTTANSFSIDYDKLAKSIAWQMRGSGNVNIKNVKQIADALKQDNDVRRYRG